MTGSLPAEYFDAVYAADADPWRFETSAYEAAKYDQTLRALGARRFGSALEIGCSIGVLTQRLAAHCEVLLAVDASEAPLARARERCAVQRHVHFACMQVPAEFPGHRFELVVTSEVAYYWSRDDLELAASRIEAALEPGGCWLLVHWTPVVPDYPLTGDEVHEAVLARCGDGQALRHVSGRNEPSYRIDVIEKRV